MNINSVIIGGALTRDPELKALPSGVTVASLSLATNRSFKDRDGKLQEEVEYHNVVVFGKQADNVGMWLKKGSSAMVTGRLKTRSWEKDGVKQYRTEIIADSVQFGPRKAGSDSAPSDKAAAPVLPDYPAEEINPEDIPF